MINLSEMWQRITATRYPRALEAEIVRLRAENRALLNSILGMAGVPPITVAAPPVLPVAAPPNTSGHAFKRAENAGTTDAALAAEVTGAAADATSSAPVSPKPGHAVRRPPRMRVKPPTDAAVPMRRRSWHQIYRMLEFDAAKKTAASD